MTDVVGEHPRSAAYFPVVMSELLLDGFSLRLILGSVEALQRVVGTTLEPVIEIEGAAQDGLSDICDSVLSVLLHFLGLVRLTLHAWKRRDSG